MNIQIRWADNTEELTKHLKQGLDQIEATRAGAERMAKALSGEKLIAAAHNMAAAIAEIGGASKLTSNELARASTLIDKAIEKYDKLGQAAPADLRTLGAELQKTIQQQDALSKKSETAAKSTDLLSQSFGKLVAAFSIGNLLDRAASTLQQFVTDSIKAAGALVDLSNKTGVSIEQLQRFQAVGATTGVSVDAFSDAAFKLGVNLQKGGAEVTKALAAMGLSLRELRAMNPDEQFNTIAAALEKMVDPQQRNTAGVALFGKTFKEIVPAIVDGYSEMSRAAQVASEDQVKAVDALGDAWDDFLRRTKTGITSSLGHILLLRQAVAKLDEMPEGFGDAIRQRLMAGSKSIEEFQQKLVAWFLAQKDIALKADQIKPISASYIENLKAAQAELANLTAAQRAQFRAAAALGQQQDFADSIGLSAAALKLLTDQTQKQDQAAKHAAETQQQFARTLTEMTAAAVPLQATLESIDGTVLEGVKFYLAHGQSVKDIATLYGLLENQVKAVAEQMKFEQAVTDATNKAFGTQIGTVGLLTARYSQFHESIRGVSDTTGLLIPTLIEFDATLGGLTNQMDYAAKKSAEYRAILKGLREEAPGVGDGLKKVFSGANIGQLITQGLTGGGGLGGAMKALVSQAGGVLTKGLGESITKSIGGTLGKTLGAIVGPLGELAGPLIAKVGGWFKGLFGGMSAAEKQTRQLRDEFIRTSGGIDELTKQAQKAGVSLTAMLNAKTPEAYKKAIDDLTAALNFQDEAMKTLDETVQRWGFTIDELGPKFATIDIGKRAQSLYQDFKVLIAAGVGFDTVIGKMGKSFNDLVADARRTGAEVPAALKPILEQMVKNGELVDEQGNAYADLADAGLVFTETMTQGFDRLIKTVERLTQAIARGLGIAIDNLPDEKNVDITVTPIVKTPEREPTIQLPEAAATGGLVTMSGIRPIRWQPIGTDVVPAMLTPGELVLNTAQQAQLGAELTRGGGGGPPIVLQEQFTFHVDVQAIDSRDMSEAVEKEILPRIITEIEDRRRGYAGRLARTLATAGAT